MNKNITVDNLKEYSKKLMFTMKEEEYSTLKDEFDILLKQVELIDKVPGIKDYEPMSFPFPLEDAYLREDEPIDSISREEAFSNCKDVKDECVSVPKVVA